MVVALIVWPSCRLEVVLAEIEPVGEDQPRRRAAVSAPKPPFSTVTTTTMGRLGWGT